MSNLIHKDLSGLVLDFPAASGIFEKYNIDYCCHGQMSLLEACDGDLVLAEDISQELETHHSEPCGERLEELSQQQLIQWIIDHHHRYVREKGPSLAAKIEKVAHTHGERHPELHIVSYVFRQLQSELEQHMDKEESVLFPLVIQSGEASFPGTKMVNAMHMMEIEHEFAGTLTGELRRLTNRFTAPPEACNTWISAMQDLSEYVTDLHQHIHLENNVLFPSAMKIAQQQS